MLALQKTKLLLSGFLFTGLAFGLLYALRLPASPRSIPRDSLRNVSISREALELYKGRLRLKALELFEKEHIYTSRATNNMLDQHRFIRCSPTGEAWLLEQKMIRALANKQPGFQYCLTVQTAFDIPGSDSYQLLLDNPQPIRGQLMRLSVWVYSQNYRHVLYALFRNANKKAIRHKLGRLDWRGWQRLEVDLPAGLYHPGKRINQRYTHFFLGFYIQSDRHAQPGQVYLMFDNLLVLSDYQQLNYPGSEIQDDWP